MQIPVNKEAGVDKIFMANHRRGSDFKTTIQNLTGAVLNLTYTNQPLNRRDAPASPTFGALTGQPATVATGATECITCPVVAINLNGANAGIVNIVEAG